jgi:hypothetical protein
VVFAADKGVKYKCAEFDSANIYNWNLANVTASLTHYDRDGSNNLINPTTGLTTDFITIDGGPTAALAIMLFDGTGELVNGFFTNNGTTVPTEITTLNGLNISLPSTGNTCGSATLNFAGISAPEAEVLSVNQAVGNNNNYWRERDGFCGTWDKGQTCNNPLAFTPGKKNSALPPINTSTAINIVALQQGCNSLGQGVTEYWCDHYRCRVASGYRPYLQ